MTRPDPPFDVADDMHWEVVPAQRWRSATGKQCRFVSSADGKRTRCPEQAVAELDRRWRSDTPKWWAYCAAHMYGNWIEDGRVVHWAARENDTSDGAR